MRTTLTDRAIDYVLATREDKTSHSVDAKPQMPDRNGPIGCCAATPFRDHLIWLGKLLVVSRIVERLVPDELWELFQRV
ncbi:hypothetical protein ABT272_42800, partial [Streptomyces sp900105245]